MTFIGGNNVNAGHARGAHLALIQGGAQSSVAGAPREASRALGTDPVLRLAATTAREAQTSYRANMSGVEGPRSNHEAGVRAIARNCATFEEALLPMVLASGVSGETASAVADAIRNNPALLAQAERAFERARTDVTA